MVGHSSTTVPETLTGPTWPCPSCTDVRDAIVRVDAVTIRGTTLHFLTGDVPEVKRGRILGTKQTGPY